MAAAKKTASPCHCINVRRVSGLISELYDRHLEPTGLSISQYSLLANLGGLSTASISELAVQGDAEAITGINRPGAAVYLHYFVYIHQKLKERPS